MRASGSTPFLRQDFGATPSPVRLSLPANARNIALVRRALEAIADELALPRRLVEDMSLAVTEACTNVVRHAYSGTEADAASVLAEARFFSGLTKTQLARVAALAHLRAFPQDTRIYTIGDALDDFYVLADGMVRFTLGLGKRETSAGDIIRRGEVFGWAPLVEGQPRRIATAYKMPSSATRRKPCVPERRSSSTAAFRRSTS